MPSTHAFHQQQDLKSFSIFKQKYLYQIYMVCRPYRLIDPILQGSAKM